MMTIAELFKLQSTLNLRVGLDADAIQSSIECDHRDDPNLLQDCGRWLDDFIKATQSELEELRNCTYWKHWCNEAKNGHRYEIHDLDGARKEIIDLLHFWISMAQAVGMSPVMVEDMYREKLAVNIKRQDDGYSMKEKQVAWELYLEEKDPDVVAVRSFEELSGTCQEYFIQKAKEQLL